MSTAVLSSPDAVEIDLIDLDSANVRALDEEHVKALQESIALRGLISPITLRPEGGRFVLIAGHHRLEACRRLGLSEIPFTLREYDGPSADSAAENILRKELTPVGEAHALARMFEEGYTAEGAASVLGWSASLVTARSKILELPENAQRLLDTGQLPVSSVELLYRIASVSSGLCAATAARVAEGAVDASQLLNNPSWVLGHAGGSGTVFSAPLAAVADHNIDELRLGKKAGEVFAEATELYMALNRHACGAPTIRFGEIEVDQARAAGVLIEFEQGAPVIVDRALYRELVKQAIARTRDELRAAKEAAENERSAQREKGQTMPSAEQRLAKDHNRTMRELARQGHGVNLDLGTALLKGLSEVDPGDVNVARFFAYALLGPQERCYGARESRALVLAATGIRLVFAEHRTSERPKLKSGQRGKEKITYCEHEDAVEALWKFIQRARTSREVFGRALIVFAAQHYAEQLVLPKSKRFASSLPPSRNEVAAKAFERLVKPILPASYKALQRAIAEEADAFAEAQQKAARKASRATASSKAAEKAEAPK